MPERERAQKRPQRRGRRDPATEQPARAARAQHVAVIDAVGTERHREHQRHHLAARIAHPGPLGSQPHQPLRQLLDPKPRCQRRQQHQARVGNDALVVELDLHAVQSDRPVILHHTGDLLTPGPGCRHSLTKPCSGGHSLSRTGRNLTSRAAD